MAIINGTPNDDQFGNALNGTNGNDEYLAMGGDDWLWSSFGSDILNGGIGNDVVFYENLNAPGGVFINNTSNTIGSVLSFTVNKGSGQIDTLIDIENFHGTNFNDVIYVGFGANYTFDRAGDDVVVASQDPAATAGHLFNAGSGNDSYTGTLTDFDTVNYFDDGFDVSGPIFRGIDVDLAAGTAIDGWNNNDALSEIESVLGTNFGDTIRGDGGSNFLEGRGGNDFIQGRGGDDLLIGGDGNDTLEGGDGSDALYGGDGNDILEGNAGEDFLEGSDGNDTLRGGDDDDRLLGGRGDDILDGGNQQVQFSGGDRASYNREHEQGGLSGITADLNLGTVIDTFGDTDTLISIEEIQGSIFNDTITGSSGDERLRGEAGNDTISGNDGNDDLSGGSGNDILNAGAGSDFIEPGSGTDTVDGGANGPDGGDELSYIFDTFFDGITTGISVTFTSETGGTAIDFGGSTDTFTGIEQVRGTNNNDSFVGSVGTQNFRGFGGDDFFDGGSGDRDLIDYSRARPDLGASQGVVVNMLAGTATDAYGDTDTFTNIERIRGTQFGDDIAGDGAANQLRGEDGNDTLSGNAGHDDLNGGDGNDILNGGSGGDFLQPGRGTDTIIGGSNGSDDEEDELSYIFDSIDQGTSNGISVVFSGETNGSVIDYNGDTDTFTGIERVLGTNNADSFVGSAGNQTFEGFGGNDTFDGGAGDGDRIDYRRERPDLGAFQGVVVDMMAGTATDGYGDTDTFINIERIRGTELADSITGDTGTNDLQGRGGNDIIDSFGGANNYLEGGDGDDTLLARGDDDFVEAGDGDDTISLLGIGGGVNPGLGSDAINGGTNGFFSIEYGGISDDLVIDILLGTTVFSGGDTDTFTNIRNIGGGDGDDTLLGDNSSEFQEFFSSRGNDTIDGRGGDRDRLIYDNSQEISVTVNFMTGTATGTFAGTDSFTNIEFARGTSGADTFIGGTQAFTEYQGLDGVDSYAGGTGQDRLSFTFDDNRGGTGAIVVDLAAGTAIDGFGNLESFTSIEQVIANDTDDTLLGDGNNNLLIGLGGNDVINGRGGTDEIYAGDGNDTITSSGFDIVFAGTGNDTVIVEPDTRGELDGEDGIDLLDLSAFGSNLLVNFFINTNNIPGARFLNFENLRSGSGDDDLIGDTGANQIDGGAGADRIRGFDGDDTIIGNAGADLLSGQSGDDLIQGGTGDDRAFGGSGNDTLEGGTGRDTLSGEAGNDTITGGEGDDILRGGDGVDLITGGGGNDTAFGGNDNDTLRGGVGNDTLDGSGGADLIEGEDGNDTLIGETGDDTIHGGDGEDTMRGGGGKDAMYGDGDDDLMFGSAGEDTMFGGDGNDTMEGNQQADGLFGENGNDILRGGDGFDFLDGGAGNDILVGGNGNDVLLGGLGIDTLRGNGQNDVFAFFSIAESSFGAADLIDGIQGIGAAGGDRIDLSTIDAQTTLAGDQAFTFLGAQTTAAGLAAGAGALWLESSGGQTRVYGNVDGDNSIDFAIRINDGILLETDYTAGDFIL